MVRRTYRFNFLMQSLPPHLIPDFIPPSCSSSHVPPSLCLSSQPAVCLPHIFLTFNSVIIKVMPFKHD